MSATAEYEIDEGGTCYPIVVETNTGAEIISAGITQRDYFAGCALTGILMGRELTPELISDYAELAFLTADQMIETRER